MARVIRSRQDGEFREAIPATRPAYIRSRRPVVVERQDRLAGLIYAIAGIIDLLLFIRFLLYLAGSAGASSFSTAIFRITNPLISPFLGLFPATLIGHSGGLVEWSAIFAILVYAVAAYVLVSLIRVIRGW